jgi:hypothetical protein
VIADEPGVDEVETRSALTVPLDELQLDLLEQIWEPCQAGFGWPVWDYVLRRLFRRRDPIVEAGELLRSLPMIAGSHRLSGYGLVWRSELSPLEPSPDQRVGLTIAGLYALRDRDARAAVLADAATVAINVLSDYERQLEPEVDREVTLQLDLAKYLPVWTAGTVARPVDLLDVLQREWAPINLTRGDGGQATVTLRMYLAPYFRIQRAEEYVRFVGQQVATRPPPMSTSPLMVAQMLDYLSLTLDADKRWSHGPLVTKPNLRSAGSIALPAATDVEFRDRLSALAILFETLSVPPEDESEAARQQKSLARLRAWLTARFADDPVATATVLGAIEDLRAVVHLRVEGQHSGSRPQAQAAAAKTRLGLPAVIVNWDEAWQVVRGRVVEALEQIGREVRSAG